MQVIKIPYDDTIECSVHDIENAKDLSDEEAYNVLKRIKELISIDTAEIVYLSTIASINPRRDFCFIVDEVGKLKDGWFNRINIRVSRFYPGTAFGDPIVGDVVFCAREWNSGFGECDLVGLSDIEIKSMMSEL